MKIFISGPMSGRPDDNAPAFFGMEHMLKEMGHDVYNPAWNEYGPSWRRADYLALDISALSRCDAMVQLDGWENSKGAQAEYAFAKAAGIDIFSQDFMINKYRIYKDDRYAHPRLK